MNKINEYIESFLNHENPVLDKISEEYKHRVDISPCIGIQAGTFISWLIALTKAKNIVEFGTCIGYSTIILAESSKANGGKLTAIESAKNHYEETKNNLIEAGLIEYVNLINGDAKTEFKKIQGSVDFILQDSLKALYPEMLDLCIEKVKLGGIIVADDTLFHPLGMKEKFSKPMHKYNSLVFSDSRIKSTVIPIGDGLTISFKTKN